MRTYTKEPTLNIAITDYASRNNCRCQNCGERFTGVNSYCNPCLSRRILGYHSGYPRPQWYSYDSKTESVVCQVGYGDPRIVEKGTVPNPYSRDRDTVYIGFELEISKISECDEVNVPRCIKKFNDRTNNFIYMSRDSSIENGFEIISHPATVETYKRFAPWLKELFDDLVKEGYRSHQTNGCGLHFHVSKMPMMNRSDYEIPASILYDLVCDKFAHNIHVLSRRPSTSMERYSKTYNTKEEYLDVFENHIDEHEYHYYGLNVSNANTVEFRFFHGTLNFDTFLTTAVVVNNLYRCALDGKRDADWYKDIMPYSYRKKYSALETIFEN